ncbi:biotin--[acetyl-CoA-carboxylase] ligase [Sphingomonas sp.]|uniref:biotin--[acetyl-CoA-carboxylase] ligase n=1 Tax=Sphingomonas sp. TaxID=28214 RepID=UPI002B8867E2|nr:biotin--[acetyl-CoA-carboxylase] ligase [Sphingomonas sp.]HWK35303.1 biotin--[acetyl-CoA-carboxylase] ligase [Sphingomonas sp.]
MDQCGGGFAVLSIIRTVAETGSTNADMLLAAGAGAAEGDWLRAERQTAGRGRQGRPWVSERGNFYGSTLVRPRRTDPPAPTLALAAAVAVEEAVSTYLRAAGATVRLALKWPNDLLLDDAKLVGILLERSGDAVVIGCGVNLAHHPGLTDRPTTSLADHGVSVDPAIFAETLAESFARWLARWRGEGLGPVRARWLERAHPIGTALSVRQPDGSAIDGLFDGLDHGGALILRLADGGRHVMHAGDVFLL